MPSYLPENDTPLPSDNEMRSLQKIVDLCGMGGGGGGPAIQQVYQSEGNPNGVIAVNTTKTCYCIDTLNHVAWVKTDGVQSNTGWTLQ